MSVKVAEQSIKTDSLKHAMRRGAVLNRIRMLYSTAEL
jgi:hypothetical protein